MWPGVTYLVSGRAVGAGRGVREEHAHSITTHARIRAIYGPRSSGASIIAETDDDNIPYDTFPARR